MDKEQNYESTRTNPEVSEASKSEGPQVEGEPHQQEPRRGPGKKPKSPYDSTGSRYAISAARSGDSASKRREAALLKLSRAAQRLEKLDRTLRALNLNIHPLRVRVKNLTREMGGIKEKVTFLKRRQLQVKALIRKEVGGIAHLATQIKWGDKLLAAQSDIDQLEKWLKLRKNRKRWNKNYHKRRNLWLVKSAPTLKKI